MPSWVAKGTLNICWRGRGRDLALSRNRCAESVTLQGHDIVPVPRGGGGRRTSVRHLYIAMQVLGILNIGFPPPPRKSILEGLGIGRQTLVCMVPCNRMRCDEARQSLEEFQIQC